MFLQVSLWFLQSSLRMWVIMQAVSIFSYSSMASFVSSVCEAVITICVAVYVLVAGEKIHNIVGHFPLP